MSPAPDPDRVNFLNQIEQVRGKFEDVDGLTARLHTLLDRLEWCTTALGFRDIHAEYRQEISRASLLIKVIKSQIDALEVSNGDFQEKYTDERESELNFRKIVWAGFSNKLRASLVSFNRVQSRFESLYESRTGANAPTPEEESVLPVGNTVARAFAEANLDEQRHKKEDMMRLERSLGEIRESFLQIAALVDAQGEMLDCIEFSMVNTKNYSHQANIQLIKARKKQRSKSLLWACCVFFVFLVLVGLGLGIWKLIQHYVP